MELTSMGTRASKSASGPPLSNDPACAHQATTAPAAPASSSNSATRETATR